MSKNARLWVQFCLDKTANIASGANGILEKFKCYTFSIVVLSTYDFAISCNSTACWKWGESGWKINVAFWSLSCLSCNPLPLNLSSPPLTTTALFRRRCHCQQEGKKWSEALSLSPLSLLLSLSLFPSLSLSPLSPLSLSLPLSLSPLSTLFHMQNFPLTRLEKLEVTEANIIANFHASKKFGWRTVFGKVKWISSIPLNWTSVLIYSAAWPIILFTQYHAWLLSTETFIVVRALLSIFATALYTLQTLSSHRLFCPFPACAPIW